MNEQNATNINTVATSITHSPELRIPSIKHQRKRDSYAFINIAVGRLQKDCQAMPHLQNLRLTNIASSLFTVLLLAPTSVYAIPADQSPTVTEAKRIEKTVVSASISDEPLTHSATQSPTSVSLEENGVTTLVTSNPDNYASIDIDNEVSAGLSFTDTSIVEEGIVAPDGTMVFPIKGSDDAYAFQIHESGSVSASAITMSPQSSQTFTYSLSSGITPALQKTGAVALYDGDVLVGIVEHPEARDAAGHDIPTSYSVVEGNLVQRVHPTVDTIYPLVTTAKIGVFQVRGDYVHVTRGQASGHGWWLKGTAKAAKAKVTVQLQYKPTKNSRWLNRGKAGVRTIKPGTSIRANARMTCRSSKYKQWRSWVDVDLIGYLDTPNKLYTPARTIKCTL